VYCDKMKSESESTSVAHEVEVQFERFRYLPSMFAFCCSVKTRAARYYEKQWRADDARLVLAYDTLQMWLEYSQQLTAELKASEHLLKNSLQHRTCNEYNPLEQKVLSLSLSLDWESAAPVPVKTAQESNLTGIVTSGLFTPGYAFAELLKAKQAMVQSNLQNVISWSTKIKSRITSLKPIIYDKQQVGFRKVFVVFEDSRSKMAQTYLDVKKSREVFSACELELKLASKGSISASTLSDKMLKMNTARDKFVDFCLFCPVCFVTHAQNAPGRGRVRISPTAAGWKIRSMRGGYQDTSFERSLEY
jgi:hypothetical protein